MKKMLAIFTCKVISFLGRILNRGSSLPGKMALKIDPDILKKVELPKHIIAVTGSNGKTSTVEMIANILNNAGKRFCYNKEGSNQIEGVTTLILNDCNFKGKVKSDILLIETDERFARHTFKYFTPGYYVINNLYRDQLTRNGNPEWIYSIIKESISPDTKLILNADDPLVSCFSIGHDDVVWFGVGNIQGSKDKCSSVTYNDGIYCPNCKNILDYEYYHYSHIGKYCCKSCGLKRNDPQFEVTMADLKSGEIVINQNKVIKLSFSSTYNLYNTLAAFSTASLLGIDEDTIIKSISNYSLKSGRIVSFKIGSHKGVFLASKHENSVSYDQSIQVVVNNEKESLVIIILDQISRKYFTSEVSWLWDINFELLNNDNVKKIILTGLYCNDLAVRFEYCGIPWERVEVIESIDDAISYIEDQEIDNIFAITCFSDKDKFLSKVEIEDKKGEHS